MQEIRRATFILLLTLMVAMIGPSAQASESWTKWAKSVGQSEDNRDKVIAKIRSLKNLKSDLLHGLDNRNRSLALDVISALQMKSMVPPLLERLKKDADGFTTLTLNSLLDDNNQDQILNSYLVALRPEVINLSSPAAVVAMLEPLGRLGIEVPVDSLSAALSHPYPEVRSAALYYLRTMALAHKIYSHDQLIKPLLDTKEFQVRLQAVSIANELSRKADSPLRVSQSELFHRCEKETPETLKNYCLSLLAGGKARR